MNAFLLALGLSPAARAVPAFLDRRFNKVLEAEGQVSPKAAALFRTLDIADLHADSLLWGRDLLERGASGHADVPRLIEGRVAVQVFGLVTQAPYPIRRRNGPGRDGVRWLALVDRWPGPARKSPLGRALYQARRLSEMAKRSGGRLEVIGSASGLRAFLARRRRGEGAVAALLALEGAHALEGRLENLGILYEAGVRMVSPAHFFDSDIGGSAHGLEQGGLTEPGRRWVAEMERRRMIIDLAHASPRTLADILALARRPVVISHTGVRGTCDNERNLSDDQLRAVARTGGVIGIGYWKKAVCGEDAASVVRAVRHAARVAGIEHVGLGSDFDGAVGAPFDAARLDRLVDALLEEGFSERDVRKIMGGNVVRLLSKTLPPS